MATLVNSPAELSWHTKVSLAHDVIKGIAYLHEQDILHRDIKTENVLVRHICCLLLLFVKIMFSLCVYAAACSCGMTGWPS